MTIPRNKLYGDEEIKIDVINLKINPELNEIVRNKNGYYQAYHMNKEHWITIDLSAVESLGQIAGLIDDSFKLT
ncbi:MmcQ/YjbR family DNA-binding protein [Enterococcus termitis]